MYGCISCGIKFYAYWEPEYNKNHVHVPVLMPFNANYQRLFSIYSHPCGLCFILPKLNTCPFNIQGGKTGFVSSQRTAIAELQCIRNLGKVRWNNFFRTISEHWNLWHKKALLSQSFLSRDRKKCLQPPFQSLLDFEFIQSQDKSWMCKSWRY